MSTYGIALVTLRDDIETAVRNAFPKDVVRAVKTHRGDFGLSEIKRYSTRAPSIILTMSGGPSVRKGGSVYLTLSMSAFVLTTSTPQLDREDSALIIVERFLRLLHTTDWSTQECIQSPTEGKSKNLYDGELDKMGIALWAIGWDQLISLPGLEDYDSLDDFATLYATYETMRPTEDPADTAASEQHIELETE